MSKQKDIMIGIGTPSNQKQHSASVFFPTTIVVGSSAQLNGSSWNAICIKVAEETIELALWCRGSNAHTVWSSTGLIQIGRE